jgi:peptidoglycan/xylan/chitin deacetylase (PgdA/CDA1 family)
VRDVVVLMYHRIGHGSVAGREPGEELYAVPESAFERQLDVLSEAECSPLPLHVLLAGAPADARTRSVAITFDDGNESDYSIAGAMLRRRGLSAGFFVTPAWVGTPGYMDWQQIRELASAGMTVGAHGLDHTRLSTLRDDHLRAQLSEARRVMEARLGRAPTVLALPGGAGGRREVRVAREVGFRTVFGSVPGLARVNGDDPIPRFAIRRDDSLATFRALVRQGRVVRLRRRLRHLLLANLRLLLGPRRHARFRDAWLGRDSGRDE